MKEYLCLDMGNTEIKAASLSSMGEYYAPIRHFPAMALEDRQTLLANLEEILSRLHQPGTVTLGLRLAFPGPFDYEAGTPLAPNSGAYQALWGMDLRHHLSKVMELPVEAVKFCNDTKAFALGELNFGPAHLAQRVMFLSIGTRFGSAFSVDGAIVDGPELCTAPFLNGCMNDYFSRRGLMALSKERLGIALDGFALSLRAASDPKARQTFSIFGQRLKEAVVPYIQSFGPQILCIGGQITKSFPLFATYLSDDCRQNDIRCYINNDKAQSILQGMTQI